MPDISDNPITDNPGRHRYEMLVDGAIAFVDYRREGNTITLTHTEVPEALAGRGIGSRLARTVLDEVRRAGLKVVPACDFLAGFIKRNPAYQDLL